MQQIFERIFDRLYAGYGIHIKSWEIIILFSMCRYAQSCAFISVIELPRIPAYCPKCVGWCFVAICSTVTVHCSYSVFGNLYEIFKIARYAIRKIKERT